MFPHPLRTLTPLDFPSLLQWYQAERLNAAGNAQDLSGNSRDGTLSNVTIVGSVVNGRPVFRFNGTTSRMTYTSITSTQNFSAFAVVKTTNATTAAGLILWVNGVATAQIVVANAAANIACFDNVVHPTSGIIDDYTNFTVIGVICTGGTCVFYQNGASVGTGIGGLASVAVTNFGAATSFFSVFDCPELVFYQQALGSTQLAVLTEYFRSRYNLF